MDSFAHDLDTVLRELPILSLAGDFAREIHWRGEDGPQVLIHYADDPDERVVVDIPHDADRPAMREPIASALDGLIRARDPEHFR